MTKIIYSDIADYIMIILTFALLFIAIVSALSDNGKANTTNNINVRCTAAAIRG